MYRRGQRSSGRRLVGTWAGVGMMVFTWSEMGMGDELLL